MTLFHIGIALATVYPRLPNDLPFPRSIGGNLSNPFRKVLLFLALSNVLSRFVHVSPSFKTASKVLTGPQVMHFGMFLFMSATESFLRSFLCLLTPYLMRCQLQNRINIPQPGRDLMIWVYFVLFFDILGCTMANMMVNEMYWGIKKLGDALSFVPVYKTLMLYNSIMTQGGRYSGRGDMTGQALMIIEYLVVSATLLSAIGYFGIHYTEQKVVMSAFRVVGAYASMTRVLCHAMLMNSKDEADYLYRCGSASSASDDVDDDADDVDDDEECKMSPGETIMSISLLNSGKR